MREREQRQRENERGKALFGRGYWRTKGGKGENSGSWISKENFNWDIHSPTPPPPHTPSKQIRKQTYWRNRPKYLDFDILIDEDSFKLEIMENTSYYKIKQMESQIHSELLQKIKKHSLIYIKWGVVPVGKEKKYMKEKKPVS